MFRLWFVACSFAMVHPDVCESNNSKIPIVSLDKGNMTHEVAIKTFDQAMRDFGCVVVTGHGMDTALIHDLRTQAKWFFELPLETKMKYASKEYGGTGYSPAFMEAVDASSGRAKTPDPIESFYLRNEATPLEGLGEFFSAIFSYRTALQRQVVLPVLRLAAQALQLPDTDAFVQANDLLTREVAGMLKLSHYPPLASSANTRYGGHTDWEGFTFLLPDEQDDGQNGLELFVSSEDRWMFVGAVPADALIVNAADFVPLWTNKQWKSPLHRVITQDLSRARLTFPYFVGPAPDTLVRSLVSPEDIKSVYAGEWLKAKFQRVQT